MIPLTDIRTAASVLQDTIIPTPLMFSPTLSDMFGLRIYLKLENLQRTGSFKIRGATVKLMRTRNRIGPLGVVAASAGNHAQGVALAGRTAGIRTTVVMPEWVSISKQAAAAGYGGDVVIAGRSLEESLQKAAELAAEGRTFIHPFDDRDIIAGQGTLGLEIMAQLPDTDLVVVPVGGGGLIAGIASAVKQMRPSARVVGVEALACPSAHASLRAGRPTPVAASASLADGISVKQIGARTFPLIRETVDQVVLVAEDQIAAAMLLLLERKKILAEGSGAVPVAALLSGAVELAGSRTAVLVISGGNVDSPLLGRIIRKGLLNNSRIMRLRVRLEDRPGALAGLLARIAGQKANVLQIFHDRYVKDAPVDITFVELELETRGGDHVTEVLQSIEADGYTAVLK